MPKKTTPVLIYLPGESTPVPAGVFSWTPETRVGEFVYDSNYLQSSKAISLDPMGLRFKRSVVKEARQDGIFGIFRDAGPDAWGRDQLYRELGDLDEFELLLKGPADGVGNVSFGETPRPIQAYSLAELDDVSRGFPPESTQIANAINPTTSMGGAKPKLLVQDAGAFWIAKFPEKGDPVRFLAANEHVMLEMARDCGVDAASSRLHSLPDGRQILLVRRFDLALDKLEVTRKGFASAYTVLGLGNPHEDARKKSYLRFAEEAMRWTGQQYGKAIWQRLVFNAMVGNIDDHPRNHALIRDINGWQLSPAFDIVASERKDQVALSMRFHNDGAIATPETLLASACLFGIPAEEAITEMCHMASTILETWQSRFKKIGADAVNIEKLEGAFKMARQVLAHSFDIAQLREIRRSTRYRLSGR
jgi:serine/threonine-protein kinase HipA